MMKILSLVPAIITSEKIYPGYWAEEQRALALDDLFLGFRASATLLLNYGVAKGVVKKAIVYLISRGAVLPIIEGYACACATRRIFFSKPMRANKAGRPTKSWKVFCGSLPSMRYHRFCHIYPFIPKRIPPGRYFLLRLQETRIHKNSC